MAMRDNGFGCYAARDHGTGCLSFAQPRVWFHGCAWPRVWFPWPHTVKGLVALAARGHGFYYAGRLRP